LNPAAHPKPEHCPDCGAELKPGIPSCWLCNYKSPPISSLGRDQTLPGAKPNWWALTGFVLLAVGFVPACCVAFFVSCLATAAGGGASAMDNALFMGLIGAAVIAVLLIVLMSLLFRSYHRSTLPSDLRNAR
jgi:hypothetical protein